MSVAAAVGGGPAALLAWGADARGVALTPDTLFPVASITKLATALAVLVLADRGLLSLEDQLSSHVPEAAAARADITIRSLLSHTSGLPLDVAPELAPYAAGLSWPELAQACLATYPESLPGDHVQYSNVGYGILALIVEGLVRQPFAQALQVLVLEPLSIEAYLGQEPPQAPAALADVRGEHGDELAPFNSAFWRSLALPWAGLVTTARGALALVQAFLPGGRPIHSEPLRALATHNQTDELAGGFVAPMWWAPCPWGLGPELRGHKQPHWAPSDTPQSFGHSGASGCLAWAQPERGVAWALLGARTADSGWLLRRGPALSEAIIAALG
jgi:beta-lactamase class C